MTPEQLIDEVGPNVESQATAPLVMELTTGFFSGMSDSERDFVLQHARQRHFEEGAVITAGSDDRRELYIIESGMALVLVPGPNGSHRILHRLGPGSIVGELSFFTGHRGFNTVRAGTDVDLLILSEARLRQVAAQIPRLYLNIGAIMAQKFADIDESPSKPAIQLAAILIDHGAPPLTGYALAASVAWHTHQPTLLLLIRDKDTDDTAASAALVRTSHHDHAALIPEPRAHLAVVDLDRSAPDAVDAAIAEYATRYHHVLIQLPVGWPTPAVDAASISLDGEAPGAPPKSGLYTVRGDAGQGASRPDHRGVLCVPELSTSEREDVGQGLLSSAGTAGHSLGWAARDLAKLKVGVALGAGSSKGFGHLGVLDVLLRAGLPIDYIAGTSIGSCVAALHALGYGLDDMSRLLTEIGVSAWNPTLPRSSILSFRKLKRHFQEVVGDRRIEQLEVPLAIVAADILTHRQVVFRRGLIWQALLCSIAIPGAFPPQAIGGHLLVDGGVVNPVPSNVAANMGADVVIGVKLAMHQLGESLETEAIEAIGVAPWIFHTVTRSWDIMQTRVTAASAETATIQIDLNFSHEDDPGLRRWGEGRRFIAMGQVGAHEALPRISAALPWMQTPLT